MEKANVAYNIRKMAVADIKSLERFEGDEFTIIYPGRIYARHVRYFPNFSLVLDINNTVEGFIIGSFTFAEGILYSHITSIFISESYRRHGFGAKLMREFEENSKALNCKYLNLFVNYRNTSAIEFYKRLNYYVHNTIPKYYNDDEDALEMRKSLE